MKKCITCKIEQSLGNFGVRKTGTPYSECRLCSAKRTAKWYKDNREKSIDKRKEYYDKHKEKTLEKSKERYWANHAEIRKRANERNRTPEERAKSNKRQKEWCKKNPEKVRARINTYDRKYPEKKLARQTVMWALRLGVLIKPNSCERCKNEIKLEAHHHDYSKPLEVNWFCRLCHAQLHFEEDNEHTTSKLDFEFHNKEGETINS